MVMSKSKWRESSGHLMQKIRPYAYLSPVLVLLLVLMAVPITMVTWYSFMDNVIMNKNPQFVGFKNYFEVLTDPVFTIALKNTAIFIASSVVAHMIIGLFFALLLNTKLLPNWLLTLFRTLFVLPWLLTVAIIAVLWRLILNPNGIANYLLVSIGMLNQKQEWLSDPSTALVALCIINIWAGYPFFMISLLAGLQGIPTQLYEAAEVDGAGPIRQLISITIPQLKPILISMALLDVIWTSQQFALIWMTTGGGPIDKTEVLPTYTYKLAFSSYQFSMASASAVIILILSMILAALYVRHQKASN